MKVFFVTSLVILFICPGYGQFASGRMMPDTSVQALRSIDDWSYKLASTITAHDLNNHLNILASDEFEGRETGTEGNKKAADYLAEEFRKLGLPKIIHESSDYSQELAFTFTSWEKLSFNIAGQKFKMLKDFVAFPQFSGNSDISSEEIEFLGYGIDDPSYSDYRDIDVKDKVLMVFDGEPFDQDGNFLISGSGTVSKWSEKWQLKSEIARKKGARMLIIVSNDLQTLIAKNRSQLLNRITELGNYSLNRNSGVNTIFLSSTIAKEILGDHIKEIIRVRNDLSRGSAALPRKTISSRTEAEFRINREVIQGQNIIGFIEGADKKEEIVIVSAHYDHIGTKGKEIYNGADDNASGTSAVLEIAEALTLAKRLDHGPRRSVLCLLVTGEEKGLLGSRYYTQNPVFPLNETIVDVNIDMIGRRSKEYEQSGLSYIYVIGSDRLSTELHNLNEVVNQKYSQLILDYKYNDEKDPNRFYYRSDHFNFAKNGIPAIFFFNGVHQDYHRLTDTVDKIDLSIMQDRTRLIFHTIWELANRNEKIKLNQSESTSP